MMKRLNRMLKNNKGFTLIEMIVVLAVVAALTAVLTPMIISYIKDARLQRAQGDVKAIAAAIGAFNKDTQEWPIRAAATATKATDTPYGVLSSTGDEVADDDTKDFDPSSLAPGSLEGQLMTNVPGYDTTGKRKWMGPYLESISEDPWGNKYYVSVLGLQPENLSLGSSELAVFVLSAGPNETINTDASQTVTEFTAGGDDIVYRIK